MILLVIFLARSQVNQHTWDGAILRTVWKLEQNGQVVISGTEARELTSRDTLVVTTTTEDSKSRSRSVRRFVSVRQASSLSLEPCQARRYRRIGATANSEWASSSGTVCNS
jgi:hypothetical protein